MNHFKFHITASLVMLLAASSLPHVSAAPLGGFAVVLDKNQSNGDSRRSLVFYDADDLSHPLFGVFLGTEAMSGASASLFEDPESITVNPETGDVYVLAFDSGSRRPVLFITTTAAASKPATPTAPSCVAPRRGRA